MNIRFDDLPESQRNAAEVRAALHDRGAALEAAIASIQNGGTLADQYDKHRAAIRAAEAPAVDVVIQPGDMHPIDCRGINPTGVQALINALADGYTEAKRQETRPRLIRAADLEVGDKLDIFGGQWTVTLVERKGGRVYVGAVGDYRRDLDGHPLLDVPDDFKLTVVRVAP